jgi:hypothetical protein
MLQSIGMNHSTSLLLFQDEPESGGILRFILLIVPALLFGYGIYLWYSSEGSDRLELLASSVVIGFTFWFIIPQKYQVFEDYLCIVLGGPFTIKIGFNQISMIEVTARTTLTMNLVNRITRNYVIIVKKKGLSIAITPKSNELFVDNANRALVQWKRLNQN